MTKFRKIALFGNLHSPNFENQFIELTDFLIKQKIELLLNEDLYDFAIDLDKDRFSEIGKIDNNDFEVDLALSLGGDGTFLTTASKVGNKNIPILGINSGRLGFLADVSRQDFRLSLKDIFDGDFSIEKRTVLEVKIEDGDSTRQLFALNDLALSKQDTVSMIVINAHYHNELINSYQVDGLIVSTPTGSTAYSMSAGGPIVVPEASNFLITPVASHSLTVRPLVVPDNWVLDLEVVSRSGCYLIAIDGKSEVLNHSTKIRVKKADYTIQVLKPKEGTFFNTLRNKLLWGADVRNQLG